MRQVQALLFLAEWTTHAAVTQALNPLARLLQIAVDLRAG
jgi:hypothetical protein